MEIPEFLQGFFYTGQEPVIPIAYDGFWVGFSILVAMVGSIAGLTIADLSKQIKHTLTRRSMQLAGAVTFGVTVWAMHFVGMLAVSIPVSMSYSPWMTLVSSFPAIIAAWFAIRWTAGRQRSHVNRATTALLIAVGIGVMHYTGMVAMQMEALLRFEVVDFTYSILIAILLSYIGIWADEELRARWQSLSAHLVGGALLGLAISGMHYEGMKSVRVIASADMMGVSNSVDRAYLGVIIFLGVIAAVGIGLSTSLITKLRINLKELNVSRAQLKTIITGGLNSVIVVNSNNEIESINAQTEQLFKIDKDKIRGSAISQLLPNYDALSGDQGSVLNCEITGYRSDGVEVQLLMRRIWIKSEESEQAVIYLMDISDFRDAERELYYQATHDSLTGLYNRRHLEVCARHEYESLLRNQRPLSALMFDLDHFKLVNDTYGHDVGDLVLKNVASFCGEVLRTNDLFFRSGGEEFVVLLPDTSKTNAMVIGEKLRKHMEAQRISLYSDSLKVTISVGVATTEAQLEGGVEELLTWADEAMYRSKSAGRNCCTHFDTLADVKTAS